MGGVIRVVEKGPGWDNSWGEISDFENDGYSASDVCCQCGSNSSQEIPESSYDDDVESEKYISVSFMDQFIYCYSYVSIPYYIIIKIS